MQLLALASLFVTAASTDITKDADYAAFSKFMTAYNRRYASAAETQGRFQIFKDNLKLIKQRNAKGNERHGINQFADVHPQEFGAQFLGSKVTAEIEGMELQPFDSTVAVSPAKKDWRAASPAVLTAVKNQGQCGSCWSFSAVEQLETTIAQSTGVLNVLSEQQVVSCDKTDGGCNGGNPINAWAYAASAGGVEFNANYPYTSGTTQADGTCNVNKKNFAANTVPTTYSMISNTASQEANMYAQIQESPMSIVVAAAGLWQTYTGGIVKSTSGCGTSPDHAVQAVGLGQEGGVYYWIIRNSWSSTWGENGFIYVEVGSNVCCVADQSTIVAI